MDKNEWQSIYSKLDDILNDFLIHYPDYKNGKNIKIRSNAERKITNAIRSAEFVLSDNDEVYELLTDKGTSNYGQAIIYDEFRQPQHFEYDMYELLNKIN